MSDAGASKTSGHASPGVTGAPAQPLIGFGQVRHTRLRPKEHRFSYATFFLLLPLRALARGANAGALAVNRRGAISFHDADHGDGRPAASGGALAWLDALLRAEGIDDATGEVWLHCYPRVLGYTFKPVSFWYCERTDGSLRAIVVEVNNTFGERHCYLLDEPAWGKELRAEKVFHVSPFCDVSGSYRFRFLFNDKDGVLRTVARIDHDDADGALIETSVSGALEPATPAALRRALWRYPVMTLAVIARIHWQALRLWTLRVGFRSKPMPPPTPISHQQHTHARRHP
ncbi:MAG: DUF1365 domain-containing protein [Giesbergeria sp.]|jgi:hypothetical protein|nr:DUF1365 domain-containing protein [Giesbergeria sp.]